MSELLSAVIESADVRFCILMYDPVSADVSSLSEALVADIAFVRPLASVSSFVSLSTYQYMFVREK